VIAAVKLTPTETELIGRWRSWTTEFGLIQPVSGCEWLTSSYLEKIASSNWETLFGDPDDGRYWEHTYPQGEMHGGGPPSLFALSVEKAHAKYGFA
jgi:hypothetical protein